MTFSRFWPRAFFVRLIAPLLPRCRSCTREACIWDTPSFLSCGQYCPRGCFSRSGSLFYPFLRTGFPCFSVPPRYLRALFPPPSLHLSVGVRLSLNGLSALWWVLDSSTRRKRVTTKFPAPISGDRGGIGGGALAGGPTTAKRTVTKWKLRVRRRVLDTRPLRSSTLRTICIAVVLRSSYLPRSLARGVC